MMNINKNTKIITNNVGAGLVPARDHKGITLVALIITIIVMLILVGVSITIALKGGLFDTTKKAAKGTEVEKNAEQELANGRVKIDGVWYDSIEDYVGGNESENQTDPEKPVEPEKPEEPEDPDTDTSAYDNAQKDENGLLKANVSYKTNGKTAIVPKGFKIVEGIEGTKSIADGLVIQDKDGNEFVWIPVEVKASDTETSIASFYRSEWENNARSTSLKDSTTYIEPNPDGYTTSEGKTEAEEYAEMVKSVYKNKGFYIGRYEAGSKTERTDTANGTTEMVVKKDQYPYNFVGWGVDPTTYIGDVMHNGKNQGKGAVLLSKELYQGKDVGVISTLCYGVQWDAMLDFIKDKKNVSNSASWGNYKPTSGSGTLKNTGSSDTYSAKNIYDIAGNVAEITMELTDNTGWNKTVRGGTFRFIGNQRRSKLSFAHGRWDTWR